ncbi:hypothetical protein DMA15_03730 [Streptomyces sp. WAC 01529]|uniref:hypothetical protein n=1 Tax=Streptomyces sp. WAC 01529 TaxID=2203205 RepID=UPI000F6F50FD|nr:hypothetical protein [Streptomyces sp. WAC 01529]AZM51804.1 hypothetical protein DMA15_03730 [Streptomyces sp. WAC 01529]
MRDAERLGCYLEAVRHAVAPYGPWGPEYDAAAHAVMALADAELESANGQIEARRIELLRVNERYAEESARVRAVADAIDTEMRTEPDTQRAAMQHEAVIRINAALDEQDPHA